MLRSLSVKLTLWASLVAVLGMASATYLSWSAARAEFLDLQLGGADRQLTASVAAAQQIFDHRIRFYYVDDCLRHRESA